MDKIHEAYILNLIKIELTNGDIYDNAKTVDIHHAEDDDGNELGFQYLVFLDSEKKYHFAKNEEIVSFTKAR